MATPTAQPWMRQPLGWLLLAALAAVGGAAVAPWRQPVAAAALLAPPANFPAPVYEVATNQPDEAAFELGRALFYDARLSSDGRVSCGNCHQQARAFTDGRALAVGVAGRRSLRNSPALQNLAWHRSFMADGGVRGLALQALAPLTSAQEMNTPLATALAKLNADPEYRRRFAAVYGPGAVDMPRFLRALAQFTSALTSTNSRYDKHVRYEPGGALSAAEQRGRALFQAKCSGCHATDLFTDESFRNNGLDASFPVDSGRAHITLLPADAGRFRVPSLRNVARTAPYMHDGRFATLAQVLRHYAHGVRPSRTLDPLLRQPDGRPGLALTEAQQQELLAFLQTLTDTEFLTNPRFAPPVTRQETKPHGIGLTAN
ncbi:MAG TPA: cytochrome c peroxidase [Hymenobacter sp.]|uniref:cytochrome-c peroxidase n=1 Tax=Hymenobacter sp. TaxID=1898978 RepID=UPI002D801086|nr:cytochrome c peroxidase [Hymenobacter sp.]HET9505749.1 cytochrome c peroxidase [Hymenobacter sp.]